MANTFSKLTSCGHCSNISNMKIIGSISDMEEPNYKDDDPMYGSPPEQGIIYSVLKCPACSKTNILSYFWHDCMESDDDITFKNIYPPDKNIPIGLPENIFKAFRAAEKVKSIDVNAYVILLRRLLELICIDRSAKGDTLAAMLSDLASRNEIPDKLVKVAKGLKDFGNIGAHAGIGELSENEIPIVTTLCTAILEYIYSAPHLATIAESKLNAIKKKKKV